MFLKTRIVEHDINEALAVKLLGWKWISFVGTPVKGTKGYPEKMRVRQLMSPSQLKHPQWIDYFNDNDAKDADMTEPLSYAYCSSMGASQPPRFTILVDELVEDA